MSEEITPNCSCIPTFFLWDAMYQFSPYSAEGEMDFNWKDGVMCAGIIIAIVGLANAFFAGTTLQCAGFALLGLVSLFGEYYVRKYPTLMELKNVVFNLRDTREMLEQDIDRLELNIDNMGNENCELQQSNTLFRNNNQTLQDEIEDMHNIDARLRENLDLLEEHRARTHEADLERERIQAEATLERRHLERIRGEFEQENNHLQQTRIELQETRIEINNVVQDLMQQNQSNTAMRDQMTGFIQRLGTPIVQNA